MYKNFLHSIFLIGSLLCFANTSMATKHVVTLSGMSFSPDSLNAMVGDTVHFMWLDGFHTTTSTSVPPGAATWDKILQQSGDTFDYVITVASTYNYECSPHADMGMVGSFTATPLTSVNDIPTKPFVLSPNPTQSNITFTGTAKNLSIDVYDLNGRKLKSFSEKNMTEKSLNLRELNDGIYLLSINADGKMYNEKVVVTH